MFTRSRAVEVDAAPPGDPHPGPDSPDAAGPATARRGTGYVVAPGLVLTAAHVMAGADEGWIRRMDPADAPALAAKTVWSSPSLDAALLRFDDAGPYDAGRDSRTGPEDRTAPRWGRLTGRDSGEPERCSVTGFLAVDGVGPGRDVFGLSGRIDPNTALFADHYELELDGPVPAPGAGAGARGPVWRGLSGAAVFCGELLTGLVCAAPERWKGSRLRVLPVRRLLQEPAFREELARAGGSPPALESAELQYVLERPPRPPRAPSFLLDPKVEATPFEGRDAELAELLAWCRAAPHPELDPVRLVVAPGGHGKTRLAVELGRRLGPEWVAGFLAEHPADPAAVRKLATSALPVLVIVDYAENRREQLRTLLRLLPAQGGAPPLRLLLLARNAKLWWRDLRDDIDNGRAGVCQHPPIGFRDTGALATRPRELVRTLADRLGALTGGSPPPHLARVLDEFAAPGLNRGYGTPLELRMAVLSALLEPYWEPRRRWDEPRDIVLRHEQKYWRLALHEARLDIPTDQLRHAVAVQALLGAASEAEGRTTLARALGYSAWEADSRTSECARLERVLADLYPAPDRARWGSLHPHPLTARLLGAVAEESGPDTLAQALAAAPTPGQREQGIRVLLRSAEHEPPLADVLRRAVTGDAAMAVTGGTQGLLEPLPRLVEETGEAGRWLRPLVVEAAREGRHGIADALERAVRAIEARELFDPAEERFAESVRAAVLEEFPDEERPVLTAGGEQPALEPAGIAEEDREREDADTAVDDAAEGADEAEVADEAEGE
ncbi:hypothetical protein ACZ90_44265 [Streptomyces albus subsp. albus]|nr:hypothetical protein ACZ90_44265 [Streptomyces albus subsp. albus]